MQAKINELRKDEDRLLIELKTFQRLEENEEKAIVKRVETLKEEVLFFFFTKFPTILLSGFFILDLKDLIFVATFFFF